MTRLLRRLLLALALALVGGAATAHEMTMAEMELREVSPGEFFWQWTAIERGSDGLVPQWPEGCAAEENRLHCGAEGLRGNLAVDGVGQRYSALMVKVFWADGNSRVYTLTAAQRQVRLYGASEDQRGMGEIAWAYTVLGVEHILSGIDHLLFVISLLFLVGFNRRLVGTITAFTAAHSLTLAASAMGWLALRSPPVEASIALSIMLVAKEALSDRPTLSRRWPALVAFLFGLVHGLGFAGALQQVGLPQQHLLVALLTFNLGVEIGQLSVVGLAFVACRWLPTARARPLRVPVLYVIGSIAAFWSIGRVAMLLS